MALISYTNSMGNWKTFININTHIPLIREITKPYFVLNKRFTKRNNFNCGSCNRFNYNKCHLCTNKEYSELKVVRL